MRSALLQSTARAEQQQDQGNSGTPGFPPSAIVCMRPDRECQKEA